MINFFSVGEETKHLVILLVLVHNICNALAYPFADPFGKGLRAAGDVKYTMYISLGTTIGVRLILSYLFGIMLHMGVMGIAYAMCLDWISRGLIFYLRFRSGKWKEFTLI